MPIHFLDSSALVKAYRREAGTPHVLALLEGSETLVNTRRIVSAIVPQTDRHL